MSQNDRCQITSVVPGTLTGTIEPELKGSPSMRELSVAVVRGNLVNVEADVYALGVFEEIEPTAALKAVDVYMDGLITDAYGAGRIDAKAGALFCMEAATSPLPTDAVCLVGIGRQGQTTRHDLQNAARAVAKLAHERGVESLATLPLGVSQVPWSVVIGSYLRELILQLAGPGSAVRRLTIVDFDEANCERLLRELSVRRDNSSFEDVTLTLQSGTVPLEAVIPSPFPIAPTDKTYFRIATRTDCDALELTIDVIKPTGAAISGSFHKKVDPRVLGAAIDDITKSTVVTAEQGRRLAATMLPPEALAEIQEVLRYPHALLVLHDGRASAIPWEAIAFEGHASLATQMPLSRMLLGGPTRTQLHRPYRHDELIRALVVSDPTGDLSGARAEAVKLETLFADTPALDPTFLSSPRPTIAKLLDALRSDRYDVLHFCGHAGFDPENLERSGLEFDDGFLTSAHIADLDEIPRLLVFNACEGARLQRIDGGMRRGADAASIGTSFLQRGVQHFVSTYWPVEDRAAAQFSVAFYDRMFKGWEIGRAVMYGRQAVRHISGRDWANYVHFGDPSARLRIAAPGLH